MAEKYGTRSKWGLPPTPGFDDDFMNNHTGGPGIPFQDYPSGSVDNWTMNYKAQPELPKNTGFQQESEFLRKGSSQNAVAGTSGNNMKVGMNAEGNAQNNLTKSDVYQSSIDTVYQSPTNVKEVYNSPTNVKTISQSPTLSNVKEVYNSNNFNVNSFDQQNKDYTVDVDPYSQNKMGAMPGSGSDSYEEYWGENMASFDKQNPGTPLSKPKRPTVGLDDAYGTMSPPVLEASDMPAGMETLEMGGTDAAPSAKAGKGNIAMKAAAAAGAITGGIAKHQQLQKIIGTLKDQRRGLEGAIGGMANESDAAKRASRDNLSEERRQIGALDNDALYNQLEKARATKTGGLSSGSVKQMQDELTDTASTKNDILLGRAEDRAFAAEDAFMAEQFNLRSQRDSQLEELNKQIKEAENEKTWGPVSSIVDAGIAVVSVANPAVGMALSVGKSLVS